jgi:ATP-dependent Clp protease ATP-binding subunit ClpA
MPFQWVANRVRHVLFGDDDEVQDAGGEFTGEASRALDQSRKEAFRLHHGYVEPRHILLALLRHESSVTPMLVAMGANPGHLAKQLEGGLHKHNAHLVNYPDVKKPFTSRAAKALDQAWIEARQRGAPTVDCRHLLLAVLHDRRTSAVAALNESGITYEAASRLA